MDALCFGKTLARIGMGVCVCLDLRIQMTRSIGRASICPRSHTRIVEMRYLSLCSLILVVATLVFGPATVSAAGWRLQFYDNSGIAGTLCRFQTFKQCLASRNSFVDTCIVDLQSSPQRSGKPGDGMPTAKKR